MIINIHSAFLTIHYRFYIAIIDARAFLAKGGKMFGYSLIRLVLFIALAIITSSAVGVLTYLVVSALAE